MKAGMAMIVMPANNTGAKIKDLWEKYPGRLGSMISLRAGGGDGWSTIAADNVPYAIDNGRYIATIKHKPWCRDSFIRLLEKARDTSRKPLFITVPDVVGSATKTLHEWDKWQSDKEFMSFGFPLAFVAQDGLQVDDVPENVDWIFIGGTPQWKKKNMWSFCQAFDNVHVGGINTHHGLWHSHNSGATSCDGTGWTRGDQSQWVGLLQYLHRSSLDIGPRQMEMFNLWEAEALGGRIADINPEDSHEDNTRKWVKTIFQEKRMKK